ncbi:MAG: helix-turn-helix transcriptional regulator [Eubacteriales bacterium]|nr:helix-turn-helix transcriptional regulator [Eubacteriales bacterium]
MILYDRFWQTMKNCGESTYTFINNYNISSSTIDRIRKGKGITTTKLDDFCKIFHCKVEDLIEYVEDPEQQ